MIHDSTLGFNDFVKLNFPIMVQFKLEPNFATVQAALKNKSRFKSGQNWLNNNNNKLLLLLLSYCLDLKPWDLLYIIPIGIT